MRLTRCHLCALVAIQDLLYHHLLILKRSLECLELLVEGRLFQLCQNRLICFFLLSLFFWTLDFPLRAVGCFLFLKSRVFRDHWQRLWAAWHELFLGFVVAVSGLRPIFNQTFWDLARFQLRQGLVVETVFNDVVDHRTGPTVGIRAILCRQVFHWEKDKLKKGRLTLDLIVELVFLV